MKSFELTFSAEGEVEISNIKGVIGDECLKLTKPYVDDFQDKSAPAVTVMNDPTYVGTELSENAD